MLIGARLEHQSIFDLFQCAALMGLKIPVWFKILKKHASNVKMGAWGLVRWEGRKSSGCPTNNIWDGISKNNNWEYTNRCQGDKQKQWAWVSFELNRWISREVLGNDGYGRVWRARLSKWLDISAQGVPTVPTRWMKEGVRVVASAYGLRFIGQPLLAQCLPTGELQLLLVIKRSLPTSMRLILVLYGQWISIEYDKLVHRQAKWGGCYPLGST